MTPFFNFIIIFNLVKSSKSESQGIRTAIDSEYSKRFPDWFRGFFQTEYLCKHPFLYKLLLVINS